MLLAAALAVCSAAAQAQVSSNQSLKGNYYFRQLALVTDGTASIVDTRSAWGTLAFDGNGNFTISGQQLAGTSPAAALAGSGAYTVSPGGFAALTSPLKLGTINARLGTGALVGSATESTTVFDLLIAIPAPAQSLSTQSLSGTYWISSLELPNGGAANIRDTNFKLTANAAGGFSENAVTGQANNLGNKLLTQSVSPMSYSVAPDGTGTLSFPAAANLDAATQLIQGVKNIYVAQDGSYFIGGSTAAGGHGIVAGVKAFPGGASNASWNGLYFAAGLRYDTAPARLTGVTGSVNATSMGSVWSRRTHQSDGVFDASLLIAYALRADGSGTFTSAPGHVNVAATGQTFATSGVDTFDSSSYELYFGVKVPAQSGPGVFLDPQRIYNAASFAPPGAPISPGGFLTLFGTGLAPQPATASSIPFPTILGGVQVSVNGTPAPVYFVSPTQINAVAPYNATGSTAVIVVTVNGTKSNVVSVPLAPTAPGVFSRQSNGLGDGAILHPDYTVVSQSNPAVPGETVQVFLTGLGAVNPAVADGTAAPAKPLASVVAPVSVYVGGLASPNVSFKGLSPGLASLYQLNVQIPSLGPGPQSLAIQTADGFTDLVNLWVASQ